VTARRFPPLFSPSGNRTENQPTGMFFNLGKVKRPSHYIDIYYLVGADDLIIFSPEITFGTLLADYYWRAII
jgi:hypothetical protein